MDFMLKNKIENGNVKGFKRMVFKNIRFGICKLFVKKMILLKKFNNNFYNVFLFYG